MAELVDAKDLKSFGPKGPCGFKSRPRHGPNRAGAISSVGLERYIDIVEVRGSNPLSPTEIVDV